MTKRVSVWCGYAVRLTDDKGVGWKILHANLAATENQKVKDLLNEILQMPNWSKI